MICNGLVVEDKQNNRSGDKVEQGVGNIELVGRENGLRAQQDVVVVVSANFKEQVSHAEDLFEDLD